MRRLQHKLSLAQQIQKQKKVQTQIIDQDEYNKKLNDLLNKMEVQNNYTNRIEKSNHNNILRIQNLESELKYLQQLKKMEELNQGQLKQYNRQLMKSLQLTQTQLKTITVELYQHKNQLKTLKNQIKRLQQQNHSLLKDLLRGKRQKIHEFTAYRQKIRQELLQTHISQFIQQNKWEHTSLSKFCIECQRSKNFKDFFNRLSQKLNSMEGILDRLNKRKKQVIKIPGNHNFSNNQSYLSNRMQKNRDQRSKSLDIQWQKAIKSYNSHASYKLF